MRWAALLLLTLTNLAVAVDHKYLVFVGTYTDSGSKGIYSFEFDADSGKVSEPKLACASENPSFLAVNQEHHLLYAANEIEQFHGKSDGSISVFTIDDKQGKLTEIQQVSSGGWGPVYVAVDATGNHLLAADYGAGNVAVLPVEQDGRLGSPAQVVEHRGTKENPARPHAIFLSRDNRLVLVPDLGLNKLFVYRFDEKSGTLKEVSKSSVVLKAAPGPRHVAVSPSGKFVYLANETNSTVTVFVWEREPGKLRELQTVSTLGNSFKGENTAAEIEMDHAGKFVYVSNRGEDSIAVFGVGSDGKLSLVGRTPTGGNMPRTFAIDPTGAWMLVANQGSGAINVFKRDSESGRLIPTSTSISIAAPAHLVFIPSS